MGEGKPYIGEDAPDPARVGQGAQEHDGGSWFGSREELLTLKRALLAVERGAVRGR